MQTTDLSNLYNYDDVHGILWLPSLRHHSETIKVENISLREAIDLLGDFTSKVVDKRKTKTYDDTDAPAYLLIDAVDKNVDVERLSDVLSVSKIPQYRGKRAVFISDALSVILVGTTVVYNQNHAAISVLDPSLVDTIRSVENEELI